MSRRAAVRAAAAIAVAAAAVIAWKAWFGGDEHAIRALLDDLVAEANSSTSDGLGAVARGARLGSFFSDDILIDLGPGTTPIAGRETLTGMAVRLQPRTAAFEIEFDDIAVRKTADDEAHVALTAIRRSVSEGERVIDASEFALIVKKVGGRWRIARVTAVDTLK